MKRDDALESASRSGGDVIELSPHSGQLTENEINRLLQLRAPTFEAGDALFEFETLRSNRQVGRCVPLRAYR